MTLEELNRIVPYAGSRAEKYIDHLNAAMDEFRIDTPLRQAAFIAQLAHESGSFRYVRELADGKAYENRKDLGNTEKGDGVKFKGRGLIQITGRYNYEATGEALGLDLINQPELLESPENAVRSAAWWWKEHGLNELADKQDFHRITRIINGGYTGFQDRLTYYQRAKEVLG